MHDHTHGSAGHHEAHATSGKRLMLMLLLSATYMTAEAVGGWWTGSLALLAAAGHMASDVASLALAAFALWVAQRPATARRTFGNTRAEILAALAQGTGLVAVPESWPGMRHDRAGLLCAAGRGRLGAGELLLTGSGASFDARADAGAPPPTVFGRCEPAALVEKMTRVASERGRPHEAVVLHRIRVTRGVASPDARDAGK